MPRSPADEGPRGPRLQKILEARSAVFSGQVRGFPCSTILPRDRNNTRSHTASTSYMLWLVHRTPWSPLRAKSRCGREYRVRWKDRSMQSARRGAAAAAGSTLPWPAPAGLLTGGEHAGLGPAKPDQVVGREQRIDLFREANGAIDHAENAEFCSTVRLPGRGRRRRRNW